LSLIKEWFRGMGWRWRIWGGTSLALQPSLYEAETMLCDTYPITQLSPQRNC
jgi:hypothetical protein